MDSSCAWRSAEDASWEEGRGKLATNQLLLYRYTHDDKASKGVPKDGAETPTRTLDVLFVIPITKSAPGRPVCPPPPTTLFAAPTH